MKILKKNEVFRYINIINSIQFDSKNNKKKFIEKNRQTINS